jgi:hypothetical protein
MLDQIKIASPCSADWEQMEGTDRVRFCGECKKNVFNLSAMTRRDAEALLRTTNLDLCTQIYRRADGTVLTADCSVGLRLKIARARRRIGWAASAALGLSTAFAQQGDLILAGKVTDATGAMIARASVTIVNERTGAKVLTSSDESGSFSVTTLGQDFYTVSVVSSGFSTATKKDVQLKGKLDLQFELLVGTAGGPMFVEPVAIPGSDRVTPTKPPQRKPWWRRLL